MPKLSLAKLERNLYAAADILRREGMDAATYKDFIFGMLFLKRCSDVFGEAREKIVASKVQEGVAKEEAEARYGENPDFYDDFFVPPRARWSYLQERLNDSSEPYGAVLDKALGALSYANESLEHVLDHISFMRTQGNKRIVSDDACRELVRHFSRYPLRNEDFQFSDLLGSAYEFLINMFAESAGKKGGDFYTPRDVIRLMVRILRPAPGMSIYDPTCGSGGMLIISREYIEQSGGDPTNLRLCGQVNDASAWSICKLNMMLHGIPGADIQHEDTLLHPIHREAGELERFDRVIANPPFSQNYTRTNMEFPERFRWGWCPTSGKKADLMFVQHMLSVCKPGGMLVTVMPHGVLFRGGPEKEIRKAFLRQDSIEAIIGLPPNLFYGAGIPACLIVMPPNLGGQPSNPNKPFERRGQVLFINADAEYYAGRAQNYLRPEHIEKIASTFERFEDVPGYARRVLLEEIGTPTNDFNLNIRRYVDNSPPPEPQDVRAHLLGCVPIAEIEAEQPLFNALNFDPRRVFTARDDDPHYCDFSGAIADRSSTHQLVENDPGVQTRAQALRNGLAAWWAAHSSRLAGLPGHGDLNAVRTEFLESFTVALLPFGVLDRFKLAGVIATWWTDTLPDLKTLRENGFAGVIDGWIDGITDALEDDDAAGPAFDPLGHKLVRGIMGDYLGRISAAKADIARLKADKETFEQSDTPDDAEDEQVAGWNYAKDLERRMREIKAENRDALRDVGRLEKAASRARATETDRRAAEEAKTQLQPVLEQLAFLGAELAPYEQTKKQLAASRSSYRELSHTFTDELTSRCCAFNAEHRKTTVLGLFAQDVMYGLEDALAEKRRDVAHLLDNWWEKYHVTLGDLGRERSAKEAQLNSVLTILGYQGLPRTERRIS
jgi:type I restriction enzyme M protein